MANFVFTQENLKKIELAVAKYPKDRASSAIMEVLYIAQHQNGWVSPEAMLEISQLLEVAVSRVKEVATFYTMYYKEPVGKFVFQVCTTTPCMLRGSDQLINTIQKELNIKIGETTEDGKFTLMEVECLGACSNAPMMQINNEYYYEDLTTESIISIIEDLRGGTMPQKGSFLGRRSAEPLKFIKR